jgi:hypothetical protein
MANKKNIKVRDLKPSKDAKGGGSRPNSAGVNSGHMPNSGHTPNKGHAPQGHHKANN